MYLMPEQRERLAKVATNEQRAAPPDVRAALDYIKWLEEERQRVREALGIHGSEIQTVAAIERLKK